MGVEVDLNHVLNTTSESQSDFDNRRSKQEELFNKFRRAVATHVRLGALTGQGKKIRQKQVDILLAVDAMSHAARGNMRSAKIVTGDQDFTPLVEALVNMGLNVNVIGDSKHTSQTLADAADVFRPLRFVDYFHWTDESARQAKPIPGQSFGTTFSSDQMKAAAPCTVGGFPATVYMASGHHWLSIHTPESKRNNSAGKMNLNHADKDCLKLFCEMVIGEVVW